MLYRNSFSTMLFSMIAAITFAMTLAFGTPVLEAIASGSGSYAIAVSVIALLGSASMFLLSLPHLLSRAQGPREQDFERSRAGYIHVWSMFTLGIATLVGVMGAGYDLSLLVNEVEGFVIGIACLAIISVIFWQALTPDRTTETSWVQRLSIALDNGVSWIQAKLGITVDNCERLLPADADTPPADLEEKDADNDRGPIPGAGGTGAGVGHFSQNADSTGADNRTYVPPATESSNMRPVP